jgi:hypothetical protein
MATAGASIATSIMAMEADITAAAAMRPSMVIMLMATMIATAGRTAAKRMAGTPVNTTTHTPVVSTTTHTPAADTPQADTLLAGTLLADTLLADTPQADTLLPDTLLPDTPLAESTRSNL